MKLSEAQNEAREIVRKMAELFSHAALAGDSSELRKLLTMRAYLRAAIVMSRALQVPASELPRLLEDELRDLDAN
jgi:hypothetical protein